MYEAAVLSFAFCFRNEKKVTAIRLFLYALTTFTLLATIQASGLMLNAVQWYSGKKPIWIMTPYVALFVGATVIGIVTSRYAWHYRNVWSQNLRYANQREINDHKATLDYAVFKSSAYDNLIRKIQELPQGIQTRIWYSEAMMDLGSTILSFIIFGAAIIYLRPIYALVLLLCSLPAMLVQFQMVSKWWNLFQKLIPEHKKRGVLERPYYQNTAFLQALMFNQMNVLRRQIDQNTDGIVAEYDKLRTENLRKVILASVASFFGVALVTMLTISDAWYGVIEYGTLTILISAAKTFQGNFESIVTTVADQWNAAKGVLIIEHEMLSSTDV